MEPTCSRIDALAAMARRLGFALRKAKLDLRTTSRPNDNTRFLEILSDLVADLGDELRARPLAQAPSAIQTPAQLLRDLAIRAAPHTDCLYPAGPLHKAGHLEVAPQLAVGSKGSEANYGEDKIAAAWGADKISMPKAAGSESCYTRKELPSKNKGQDAKHKSSNLIAAVSMDTCAEPGISGSSRSMPPSTPPQPPPSHLELLGSLQRASRWLSRPLPTMTSAFPADGTCPGKAPDADTAGICWCGCYVWPMERQVLAAPRGHVAEPSPPSSGSRPSSCRPGPPLSGPQATCEPRGYIAQPSPPSSESHFSSCRLGLPQIAMSADAQQHCQQQ